jgi:hypothetical protein
MKKCQLLLLIFLLIFTPLAAQDYVQNLKVRQLSREIEIAFNLVGKYSGSSKIKSFKVSLLCSTDNGKTYQQIETATGDVGGKIISGLNKKIIYTPGNDFNSVIGNYLFKVNAVPSGNNDTFGIEYLRGYPTEFISAASDQIRLNWYELAGSRKLNLMMYIGYYRHSYSLNDFYNFGKSTDNVNLFTIGFGIQTLKRQFAISIGGGIGKWTTINQSTGNFENNDTSGSLTVGVQVKLLDTKSFTVSIPGELGAIFGPGTVYVGTGLSLQF